MLPQALGYIRMSIAAEGSELKGSKYQPCWHEIIVKISERMFPRDGVTRYFYCIPSGLLAHFNLNLSEHLGIKTSESEFLEGRSVPMRSIALLGLLRPPSKYSHDFTCLKMSHPLISANGFLGFTV